MRRRRAVRIPEGVASDAARAQRLLELACANGQSDSCLELGKPKP